MFDYYTTFTLSRTQLPRASEIDQRAQAREREQSQFIASYKANGPTPHFSRNLLVRLLSVFNLH